jgi:hypothetical protein
LSEFLKNHRARVAGKAIADAAVSAKMTDTYGHLRREHSLAQAQRVSFTPNEATAAEIVQFPLSPGASA